MLTRRMARRREEAELAPVIDANTLLAMQAALEDVAVEDSIGALHRRHHRGHP